MSNVTAVLVEHRDLRSHEDGILAAETDQQAPNAPLSVHEASPRVATPRAASGDDGILEYVSVPKVDLAASGGRAGLLDISSSQLALVDTLDKTPAGALGMLASSIGDSGAGSVLLGGRRQAVASPGTAGETWAMDASGTQSVRVDIGTASLSVEELLLAATGSITLADGTRIAGKSAGSLGARTLQTQGDGAFVAVGANALNVLRSGDQLARGTLHLGRNVDLSGPQLALDAMSGADLVAILVTCHCQKT